MALETRVLAKVLSPDPQTFIDNPQLLADWIYIVAENMAILSANAIVSSGDIKITGGDDVEDDWLVCDGQAVSRATYFTLFDVIGTDYGSGDGSSTFNLPDLRAFIVDNTSDEVFTLDGPIKSPFTVVIKA